jgi:hypothetical protein
MSLVAGRALGLAVLSSAVLAAGAHAQSTTPKAGTKPKPPVMAPKGAKKPIPPTVQKLLKEGQQPDNDEVPVEVPKVANDGLPPGAKWLKDKDGQLYYIDKLDKSGPYLRLSDKKVRTRWGVDIEVIKEDEKFFYFRVNKPQAAPAVGWASPKVWTPEELEAIAASYRADTPESTRLTFTPFDQGLPKSGQWRNGFDIADMNEDGHPDIVFGPARKSFGNPAIFLGDGKGGWKRWPGVKYPPLPFDYGDASVADLNGDGHLDVALGMHLRGVVAILGDGKGKFTESIKGLDLRVPGSASGVEQGFSSRAVTTVDWNKDGKVDILALGEGPRMNAGPRGGGSTAGGTESFGTVVYINQGDGTWQRKDQGTSSRELFGDRIIAADMNNDGYSDFVTSTSAQGDQTLVNLGRPDGTWDGMDVDSLRPGAYIWGVTVGDFDGDGRRDLALGFIAYEAEVWRTALDVFFARPDGTWKRKALAAKEGREGVTALDAGDLDGDGHLDLVALTGDGQTWVFLGDGKGSFTREVTNIPPYEGSCRGYAVRLADLDKDGTEEIVESFAGENSPQFAPDLCLSGGGIKAWKVTKKSGS